MLAILPASGCQGVDGEVLALNILRAKGGGAGIKWVRTSKSSQDECGSVNENEKASGDDECFKHNDHLGAAFNLLSVC